jgi:integrase
MAKTTEKLSALQVRNLKEIGRHSDGGNLYIDVRPTGKFWSFIYGWGTNPRTGRRKIIECGLGSLASVSLKAAREKAAEGREFLNENPPRNPKDVWADQRSASNVPTFGQMADEFLDLMEKEWRSGRHLDRVRATIENHCGPILKKPVDQVTQEDVLSVVSTYAEKAPTSATKLRGTIEEIWYYAQDEKHIDKDRPNPAIRRKKDRRWPKAPKATHHPTMPYADLPGFMGKLRAARVDGRGRINVIAYALQFVILTAGRSGEIRLARWDEFNLDARSWSLPPARMKAGLPHTVPLTDGMLTILKAMDAIRRSQFVFPGSQPGQPLTAKSFERLLERLGAGCVCHGFRTVFRNWAGNKTSTEREICEMALAHQVKSATEGAYWREHPLDKHRKLLELWDQYLSGQSDNVVQLRSA